jgi:acyl-[acyl-carrier-protein]-phospholipid O-acyltransferase/long-chain-fatty-acid--[acyl-carrier-protein] ligase
MTTTNVTTIETARPANAGETGWQAGFWSLIVTQFQGAFSDNALKQLVIFIVMGAGMPAETRDKLVPAVGALFALPFILFSMLGGFWADRRSKRTITIGVKCFEIAVMTLALIGLSLRNLPLELTSVFLMGVHSAIFGPSKYGLLPEVLPEKKLSWGNGILELGTFLAIILGTMLGGILSDKFKGEQHWSGVILIALAVMGLLTSFGITKVRPANPTKKFNPNPLGDLMTQMRIVKKDRPLALAVIGNIYFSYFGALVLLNVVVYGKDSLGLDDTHNSYLTAALALGIGFGSLAAGYLSGEKIQGGFIRIGAIGMTIAAGLLGIPRIGYGAVAAGLAVLGFFGGFFIVPVAAILQRRPPPESKGGVLAAANLTSFIGIFAASGVYFLLTLAHLSPAMIFAASAVMTFLGAVIPSMSPAIIPPRSQRTGLVTPAKF